MLRRSGLTPLFLIVLLAAVSLGAVLATGSSPKLGLDLAGGFSVTLQPDDDDVSADVLDQAIEVIRSRVDGLGAAEPEITRQGSTIVVNLPGVTDRERATELVGTTAELRFRPVVCAVPDWVARGLDPGLPEEPATTPTTAAPDAEDEADIDPGAPEADAGDGLDEDEVPVEGQGAARPPVAFQPTPDDDDDAGEPDAPDAPDTDAPDTGEVDPDGTDDGDDLPITGEDLFDDLDGFDPGGLGEPTGDASLICSRLVAGERIAPTTRDDDQPDQVAVFPYDVPGEGPGSGPHLLVVGPTVVTGDAITAARAELDQMGIGWTVRINIGGGAANQAFNQLAAQCFSRQGDCEDGRSAIVLDSEVVTALGYQEPSFAGSAVISGDFNERRARDLALVLRYGSLPVQLETQETQVVSATLGRDSLEAGLIAGSIGLAIVALYMVAYYRLLGLVAMGSLAVSASLLWAVVSWLGETQGLALTLAGITGIIVSIGVAVDSNVVFYENLKEDVSRGRTLRSAVSGSFTSAFSTIVKANVATLIGAILLYWLTVGPVRGFALFLGLATVLDMVASYFFMRPLVVHLARSPRFQDRPRALGMRAPAAVPAPAEVAP